MTDLTLDAPPELTDAQRQQLNQLSEHYDGRIRQQPEETTPDVLECVSRAELMKRNTLHRLPPEQREVYRMHAQITRRINQLNKTGEENDEKENN